MQGKLDSLRVLVATTAAALIIAPAAFAQGPIDPQGNFGHDDSLDGTAGEITSGFGPDNEPVDPIAQRLPNSFEYFDVTVPAQGSFASFTVTVRWQDPRLDFDMYLYRQRPNGTWDPASVASSAGFGDPDEQATVFNRLASEPLRPGSVYRVFVDNWCTRDDDPDPRTADPADTANCGIDEDVPDEDDFVGSVVFNAFTPDNRAPTVGLTGPDTGRTGQLLSFTADGRDDDGVTNYAFDLDGDGRFETNAGRSSTVAKRFDVPGTYNIGVRAIDARNAAGFANRKITITGPPLDASGKPLIRVIPSKTLLSSFRLGSPVFGGRSGRRLEITYRLKERATVDVRLQRGKKTVRRLVRSKVQRGGRTHTLNVRPRGLKQGLYTVRMVVRTSDGRRQLVKLRARRL